ncbi:DUF433 domain-containing protein [Microbacterium trichothecenolyticum]|uniref:DUF433 domain-containing protein n=1 Tax=Microbacterium trichothecenolyticum TaxID=69370 RepID=UPI0035BE5121
MTSKLSGTTIAQLAYWRRTDVLVPEIKSSGRPLLYSFRDIYALRTFARLRQELPLQQIRRALRTLQERGPFDHPADYKWFGDGDSIVLWREGDNAMDAVKHPGQTLLATFEDVLSEFTNRAGQHVADLRRPAPFLEVEPARLGGWPTIEGTRVPFDAVADLVADGSVPVEDIGDYYPSVTPDAARSALRFAQGLEAA